MFIVVLVTLCLSVCLPPPPSLSPVCLCLCLSVCLSVCLSLSLSLSLSFSVCLSVCLSLSLSLSLSPSLPPSLPLSLSLSLSPPSLSPSSLSLPIHKQTTQRTVSLDEEKRRQLFSSLWSASIWQVSARSLVTVEVIVVDGVDQAIRRHRHRSDLPPDQVCVRRGG